MKVVSSPARPGRAGACRLCGAILDDALPGPRRVCGTCGEVNYGLVSSPVSAWDFAQFLVGAAPAPLAVLVFFWFSSLYDTDRSHQAHSTTSLNVGCGAFALLMGASIAMLATRLVRRRGGVVVSILCWVVGLGVGCVSPVLLWLGEIALDIYRHGLGP